MLTHTHTRTHTHTHVHTHTYTHTHVHTHTYTPTHTHTHVHTRVHAKMLHHTRMYSYPSWKLPAITSVHQGSITIFTCGPQNYQVWNSWVFGILKFSRLKNSSWLIQQNHTEIILSSWNIIRVYPKVHDTPTKNLIDYLPLLKKKRPKILFLINKVIKKQKDKLGCEGHYNIV